MIILSYNLFFVPFAKSENISSIVMSLRKSESASQEYFMPHFYFQDTLLS